MGTTSRSPRWQRSSTLSQAPEAESQPAIYHRYLWKSTTSLHKTALYASVGLLVVAIVIFAVGQPLIAGPLLTAFFGIAAFGVRGNEKLRGISFSLLIFAAVSLAMNYPSPFVSWGDFGLDALIVPLLQIIMFGMGTAMSAGDFVGVVKAPRAVLIGLEQRCRPSRSEASGGRASRSPAGAITSSRSVCSWPR
jgi:hypothetical protein